MIKEQRKRLGAFYTPAEVADTLVRWVVRRGDDRLLDPSCGDGEFLAAHRRAVGIECDPAAAAAAHLRAPWSQVHVRDFFDWTEVTTERFTCAAGNPPFVRYQHFSGEIRGRALRVCAALGARFSSLTSSWAPFLVGTAARLVNGGRMAFVVPAEIGHAPYASPAVEYLVANFRRVLLVAVRRKIFPSLSEDAWLLYAEGFGGRSDAIELTRWERFRATRFPPSADEKVTVAQWRMRDRRLRPFLMDSGALEAYDSAARDGRAVRLGDVARVGIGYVTGANDFFHLRPSRAREIGIPDTLLAPAVRNARQLPDSAITEDTVADWLAADAPVLLLRIERGKRLPAAVVRYLESAAGRSARATYKCRNRQPWYVVPDVRTPDAFLSYMSGERPTLVANRAKCVGTNSVHVVHLTNGHRIEELQTVWDHPLVELSCELEGHPLGGGVLKLEPREAGHILLPRAGTRWSTREVDALRRGCALMRGWRHYG